jgi:hypothetical protein
MVRVPFPREQMLVEWKEAKSNERGRRKDKMASPPPPSPTPSSIYSLDTQSRSRPGSLQPSRSPTPSLASSSAVVIPSSGSSRPPPPIPTLPPLGGFEFVRLRDGAIPMTFSPSPSTSAAPSLPSAAANMAAHPSLSRLVPPPISAHSTSLPSALGQGSKMRVANPGTILVPPVIPGRSQSVPAPEDVAEDSSSSCPQRKREANRKTSSTAMKKRRAK